MFPSSATCVVVCISTEQHSEEERRTNLHNDERIGKSVRSLGQGRQEDEELLSRSVTHELKVVGRVLVVTRDVERHHALEEDFGRGVEGEEGIPIDVEELAGRRMGTALQRLL